MVRAYSMTTPPSGKQIPFGDFIEYLRYSGFTISIAHHLRLQHLLNTFRHDCSPEDLKTLLCPLFATSADQQEKFYKIFDDYFAILNSNIRVDRASSEKANHLVHQSSPQILIKYLRFIVWLSPTILIFSLITVIPLGVFLRYRTQRTQRANVNVANNDDQNQPPENETSQAPRTLKETATNLELARQNASVNQKSSKQSFVDIDVPPLTGTTGFAASNIKHDDFYHRYGAAIRLLAIASPIILFLIYEVHRGRRRSLILLRQRGKKPPLVWPIQIPETQLSVYNSELFYQAARALRRRHSTQVHKLNVTATIAATINSLGYLSIKYQTDSAIPEYLFLIDRKSPRDHQAQMLTVLSKKFEAEGVYIDIYYFNIDPRVCFSEKDGRAAQLDELLHKYSDRRLVLFTDAEGFVDPISGAPESWTSIFKGWHMRAVSESSSLTPWAVYELSLIGEFSIFPCSLAGVQMLADAFADNYELGRFIHLQDHSVRYPHIDTMDAARTMEEIRRYLGDDVFKWFCACSIYPELHWALTLFLGSLQLMPGGIVSEENLLSLISLPYFRSGFIPDDLRQLLMRELTADDQAAIRRELIGILEKNPPPAESIAADNYQLNLVVQRWLVRPNFKRWMKVRRTANEAMLTPALQDLTLVKYVEAAPPIAFILPRRLHSVFFRRGIPVLGTRTVFRFLVCMTLAASAWFGIRRVSPTPTFYKSEQTLVGHTGTISALTFASTGERLATAGTDNQIILWEQDNDRWRPVKYLHGISSIPSAIALSNSGRFVAGVSNSNAASNRISLWEMSSNEPLWELDVPAPIKTIFFSRDLDRWLVVAHEDKQITLFNPYTGKPVRGIRSSQDNVSAVALSKDSSTLAGGSEIKRVSFFNGLAYDVTLWNPFTGAIKGQISTGAGVHSLAISDDGKILITSDNEGKINQWAIGNGNVVKLETFKGQVRSVIFSEDNSLIAGIDENNALRIWETYGGDLWLNYQLGIAKVVPQAFCFSLEGDVLIAGAEKDSVHIWRLSEKNRTPVTSSTLVTPVDDQSAQKQAIIHTLQGKLMWVDESGNVVRELTSKDSINSFFLHGIEDPKDETTRIKNKAHMQLYFELVKAWEDKGIGKRVSEVFLSNLEDVRVHLAGDDAGIEVALGSKDFSIRLERALRAIDENRRVFNHNYTFTTSSINYVDATSDKKLIIGVITEPVLPKGR